MYHSQVGKTFAGHPRNIYGRLASNSVLNHIATLPPRNTIRYHRNIAGVRAKVCPMMYYF